MISDVFLQHAFGVAEVLVIAVIIYSKLKKLK